MVLFSSRRAAIYIRQCVRYHGFQVSRHRDRGCWLKHGFRSGYRSRNPATCLPASGCGPPQPRKSRASEIISGALAASIQRSFNDRTAGGVRRHTQKGRIRCVRTRSSTLSRRPTFGRGAIRRHQTGRNPTSGASTRTDRTLAAKPQQRSSAKRTRTPFRCQAAAGISSSDARAP